MFAGPPKRAELPEWRIPPNGAFASSPTVWSLLRAVPVGMRRAISSPVPISAVMMLRSSPYSLSDARSTASPGVANEMIGATGPNTSLSYASVSGTGTGEDRRAVEEPVVRAAGAQRGACRDAAGDQAVDLIPLALVDNRAQIDVAGGRVADGEAVGRGGQLVHVLAVDRLVHQMPADDHAALARVEETSAGRGGRIPVDHRRLPAQPVTALDGAVHSLFPSTSSSPASASGPTRRYRVI
jgi:hypothetical protein